MEFLSRFTTLITEYLSDRLFDSRLLLVIVSCFLIYKLVIVEYFSPLAKIPGPRPSWLCYIKMNYHIVFKPESELPYQLHQHYGSIIRVGPRRVSIASPDLVRAVYASYRFPKSYHYKAFDVYEENIFSTRDNALHKHLKRLIAPAYSESAIKSLEPFIREVGISPLIELLRKRTDAGEPVDLFNVFQNMTFDVIGKIGFGRRFDLLSEGKPHSIMQWMDDMTNLRLAKAIIGDFLATRIFKQRKKSEDALIEFAKEAVRVRRSQKGGTYVDTLQRLIESVDPETGARLSDQQLVSESIVQLAAGTDTTAITLGWIMYMLHQHPECLERLRKEVQEAVPDLTQPVTYEAVRDLVYLNAVISETLRLYQTVRFGFVGTVPEGGAELGGYYLPGKTTVLLSMQALSMDPNVFQDPTAFKPERWLDEPEKVATLQQSSIPFLIGPRACIGRSLARMEMRLTIAELVRHFRFTTPEHLVTDMTPVWRFITRPKDNKYMVMVERVD